MECVFNTQNFDTEVLRSQMPVLVDFYADWCGPCKMMAPTVEELAADFAGKAKVGKLNVDLSPEIAERYEARYRQFAKIYPALKDVYPTENPFQ